jgi:hypothetical protein
MSKLILAAILVVTIAPPILAAMEVNSRTGLRKLVLWTVLGVCAYELAVIFLYPRFLG